MKARIALFTNTLSGGGMERAVVNIANQLIDNGYQVDLLLSVCKGCLFEDLDSRINVVCLDRGRRLSVFGKLFAGYLKPVRAILLLTGIKGKKPKAIKAIQAIRDYLVRNNPVVLISTPTTANIAAIIAANELEHKPKLIIREASTLSIEEKNNNNVVFKRLVKLVPKLYPCADRIICVSKGVREDMVKNYQINDSLCEILRNPIDRKLLEKKSREVSKDTVKFLSKSGFILGLGRLELQKDFFTLIKAFKLICDKLDQNLLILGEGSQRKALEELVRENGLEGRVFMPGFMANPYPYLAACECFVLSSRWEGLANVLREAMLFGRKIVATDCPSGTKEILEEYKNCIIVPVVNEKVMANAIQTILKKSCINEIGTSNRSIDYLNLIESV